MTGGMDGRRDGWLGDVGLGLTGSGEAVCGELLKVGRAAKLPPIPVPFHSTNQKHVYKWFWPLCAMKKSAVIRWPAKAVCFKKHGKDDVILYEFSHTEKDVCMQVVWTFSDWIAVSWEASRGSRYVQSPTLASRPSLVAKPRLGRPTVPARPLLVWSEASVGLGVGIMQIRMLNARRLRETRSLWSRDLYFKGLSTCLVNIMLSCSNL